MMIFIIGDTSFMDDIANARKLAEKILEHKKLSSYDVPNDALGKRTSDNNDKTDKENIIDSEIVNAESLNDVLKAKDSQINDKFDFKEVNLSRKLMN